MEYSKVLLPGMIMIAALLLISGCSTSRPSDRGVARIDQAQVEVSTDAEAIPSSEANGGGQVESVMDISEDSTVQLTDEEIVTHFASCMREHGFDTSDPQLNADGTVDRGNLRGSIVQDPKFNPQSEQTQKVLRDCLPLLQGATFARASSPEDEIELQDNILQFAQCLRDNGVNVPDPDFSEGTRGSMRGIIQQTEGVNFSSDTVQESLALCQERSFTGQPGSNPRGRGTR